MIGDEEIEESLDIMKWALADHPLGALSDKDAELIALNDGPFKSALDRTKYATRFPGTDPNAEREKACTFIATLEARLSGPWLGGDTASLADYAYSAVHPAICEHRRDMVRRAALPTRSKMAQQFFGVAPVSIDHEQI